MQAFTIAPSILSANFACLGEEVKNVLAAGADVIHFDVMDNHYVPNLSVGPLVCQALRDYGITAPIDVHLMVSPVDPLITRFADAGASAITFHPDASTHVHRSLNLIRDAGCQAGLAFNPATPLHYLDDTLDLLDNILIMSVNPGFGGQTFIPHSLAKIQRARQLLQQHAKPITLAVDGGIHVDNIAAVAQAGADFFVVGSAIFTSTDYVATLARLRAALQQV